MTSVVPTPIFVMSGFSESNENSAVHVRDDSSGQRTDNVSADAETVMGPGRTPEMSAGTMLAMLRMGMKKMRHRIAIGLGDRDSLRLQHKGIERISCACHQVLLAVQHIRLRAVAEIVGEAGMPEDVAVCWIERNQVLRAVAREQ